MTKASRLLEIITILSARRFAMRAEDLAERLDVSVRTIYRDIDDLRAAGADIHGEAGTGYHLADKAQLAPLMFDEDEIMAVLAGIEMVGAFTDDKLDASAQSARQKIISVLSDRAKAQAEQQIYFVPKIEGYDNRDVAHSDLREAILQRKILNIQYSSLKGHTTKRNIWPLGLVAWFGKWTIVAWCETRGDYRNFRIDLIDCFEATGANYSKLPEQNFQHFLKKMQQGHSEENSAQ